MRILIASILLPALHASAFAAGVETTLHDRCIAAIAASGQPADAKALNQTMNVPMGEQGFLFQFTDAAGGTFSCQVCDDGNPAVHACGSAGLRLSFRPKDGEGKDLPAELDKKCAYYLQKEVNQSAGKRGEPFIDHALMQRIQISADHTDTRWVYKMALDGTSYRCVIRRNDGNFRVERQNGEDWRPIAAGILF